MLHAPPAPSRRPIPKTGLANPRAKPSRVKANIAAREEAEAERGGAAPRVFHGDRARGSRTGDPKRAYGKPREDRPREDRSREDRGDRPYRPREGASDRPYKPREGASERPRGDRPYRSREGAADAPRGPRTFKPSGKPRDGERSERPEGRKPGWAKPGPGAPRRDGDKPFRPRADGAADRPRGAFRPKAGARPDDTRPTGPGDDGPKRSYGGKPAAKPGGFKRSPASRGPGAGKPGGFKPRGGKPGGPRKP